jgi:hypothetical protein
MINKKRKKIVYVPGMISLVFIPLFCMIYFYKIDSFTVYGLLDITFADDKSFEQYKVPYLRRYNEFIFNGSKSIEDDKLNELQIFLRELVKTSDTINGVKVHFGSKTDYDVFVQVIQILKVEKVPTWAPYNDDIYILIGSKRKSKIEKNNNVWVCGTIEATRQNTMRLHELKIENENRQFQLSFFKKQWILFVGYFGIVFLNIFALVKFNKKR